MYDELVKLARHLKELPVKIDGIAVDCGGRQWEAATEFAKNSMKVTGMPFAAFAGKSSMMYNGFIRSRLRNEIAKTVLCGDPEEHARAGAGHKYTFWNADYYKEVAQRAFTNELGNLGSC